MTTLRFTALVLAAQRPGIVNALASHFGVSHKCTLPVNGTPMLDRVVGYLADVPEVDRIAVSIEDPAIALALPGVKKLHDAGRIVFTTSRQTLSQSVVGAIDELGGPSALPLFITTADNCLHSAEIVSYFLKDIINTGAEAAWGMTDDALIQQTYPGTGKITGRHVLRDAIWSNCNIYSVVTERALGAIELFRAGGQFGNKKKRRALLPMVGLWSFLLYRYGLTTLSGLEKRAGKAFGIKAHCVRLPFADAPIDADDLVSYEFIEARLKEREGDRSVAA
ncbi:NTP transferase domain-containing protein [Gimibacter soli]|uniref:NTP transferase domain-containing protein n=1 Tax=Gimibacter soli TaxID=3024400 RepID=A0AAE9XU32_9PROT|nr:NTP transferase domain-containing protein [Gimibacter soli]WCL54936.1 NTP transferase domain-containing protein [Gimibacter soli]